MIEIKNLSFAHGSKTILADISWQAKAGFLSLILGANGAGKSSLLNLLAGDYPPLSGEILWDHHALHQIKDAACYRGVLSQQHALHFPLRVDDVVALGRYPHARRKPGLKDHEIVAAALKQFELEALAARNIQSLSGGEQQRVHFARVWVQMQNENRARNPLLLIDEPTTFLDIHHQWKYLQAIREETQKNQWISIGVLHDLSMAYQLADEVLVLHENRVLACGPTQEVLIPELIKKVFAVESRIVEGQLLIDGV